MSDIDKVFAGLDTRLVKFKREFGVEATERVKQRTPVITGRLQGGWGFEMHMSDISFYNVVEYASFVEYGTPYMAPRAMLQTTMLESQQIAEVAAQKAGLKK